MTLLMCDQENIEKGRTEGIEQGENRYALLTQRLLQEKQYDSIRRISVDKGYRQELYKKHHIL